MTDISNKPSGDRTIPQGETEYRFSNAWFEQNRPVWEELAQGMTPKRILEIGSFEGQSTCFMIEKFSARRGFDLHCIDTWQGGVEHQAGKSWEADMTEVEARFDANVAVARRRAAHPVEVIKHKALSSDILPRLVAAGMSGSFDLIYVDGSHEAADVLYDAVLSFQLLKTKGYLIFDDYFWFETSPETTDILRTPKMAIDAFVTINFRKLRIYNRPIRQIYLQKLAGT